MGNCNYHFVDGCGLSVLYNSSVEHGDDANINSTKSLIKQHEAQWADICIMTNMDYSLYARVQKAFKYYFENNAFALLEDDNFLKILPNRLYHEVYEFLFCGIMKKCPFFDGKE